MKPFISLLILLVFGLFLSGCGQKKTVSITPTPMPRNLEIALESRPYISLTPRDDGHMLYLKITKIPDFISQIEYELIYTAVDNGNEIEKGVGDTIKDIKPTVERSMLLGTESCTNGCKYKYDNGIVGGTLTLNFISKDNQIASYQTPFSLKSTADIKKESGILKLPTENFSIKTSLVGNAYFVLLKNYNNDYSVFSNQAGNSKFLSTEPKNISKTSDLLVGDYSQK